MDFLNEDVTKSKAQEYIDLMSDLQKVIDKQRVNKATKEAALKVFNTIVMKACESECRGEMLAELSNKNEAMALKIKQLQEGWQKEREELNALLEETERKIKPEKIEVPSLEVSVILKDGNKKLTNKECCKLFRKGIDNFDELNETFTRMKVNNDKVTRVYIKKSLDGIDKVVQKETSAKK